MTRIERRLLIRSGLLGVMLTLLVLIADWRGRDGLLSAAEQGLYDLRARRCQFFTPPPTDKLVHIDIDDPSLQYMGQWPWPRTLMAQLTDEMRQAGAKAVAFDILFAEPEPPTLRRTGDPAGKPGESQGGAIEEVSGDAEFSAALHRFGAASILPASFEPRPPATALGRAVYEQLYDDLLLDETQVQERLTARGDVAADSNAIREVFDVARKEAIFHRILRLIIVSSASPANEAGVDAAGVSSDKERAPPATTIAPASPAFSLDEVTARLFEGREQLLKTQFPLGLLKQQYGRAVAFHSLRRFARPIPPGLPPFVPTIAELLPIAQLSRQTGASSYVSYLADRDGVVRTVDLWRDCEGLLYPQLGLMLACAYLDVDINDVQLHADRIIIPRRDAPPVTVPVFMQHVDKVGSACSMHMPLPWFGPTDGDDAWTRMYDYGRHEQRAQHLPMLKIWEAIEHRRLIRANTSLIHSAIGRILTLASGEAEVAHFKATAADLNDTELHLCMAYGLLAQSVRLEQVFQGMDQLSPAEFEAFLAELPDEKERFKVRTAVLALQQLPHLIESTWPLVETYQQVRTALREQLDGKALLVGFTAAGRHDVVPTSMMPRCPGAVVHGVVFNAILTGDVWTVASPWVTRLLTLALGLIATAIVSWFHPINALLSSAALAAGYLAFNGIYLFDYHNTIVGAAAPLVAIGLVWSGCTLMRFIVERAERRHIENRFRSYVDPALVNAILEHPEKVNFEGESREMTVVFTDLEGFTTLSEKLKARTVPILNEYMGRMVSIIRDEGMPEHRRGYRNKFLGDGIMFFFGAPLENEAHAMDAVATVMHMQAAMPAFNDWLKSQDLPPVKMRAGISTGEMIVGDAGSPDAADYTVLGDDVNFGARLESANKAVGTLVMISQRTKAICESKFLCRPIARLQVVGKSTSVKVYEPLCEHERATEAQQELARLSEDMVEAFTAGDFAACLAHVANLEARFGPSKLTALYRRECEGYLVHPPGDTFDGTIVLSEK